jgi:hypothetical protein
MIEAHAGALIASLVLLGPLYIHPSLPRFSMFINLTEDWLARPYAQQQMSDSLVLRAVHEMLEGTYLQKALKLPRLVNGNLTLLRNESTTSLYVYHHAQSYLTCERLRRAIGVISGS